MYVLVRLRDAGILSMIDYRTWSDNVSNKRETKGDTLLLQLLQLYWLTITFKITTFWDVTPYSLVEKQALTTTSQKTVIFIFITMRNTTPKTITPFTYIFRLPINPLNKTCHLIDIKYRIPLQIRNKWIVISSNVLDSLKLCRLRLILRSRMYLKS
jgi:hypothetical protein